MTEANDFQLVDLNYMMMAHSKNVSMPAQKKIFKNVVANLKGFITEDDDFMIITNQEKVKPGQVYYSLLLDKEKLHLVERSNAKKREIYYFFEDSRITLNNQDMNKDFINEFNARIEKIVSDLKMGKAKAFDKA